MLDKQLTKFLVLFYVLSCTYSVTVAFSHKLIEEPFNVNYLRELFFAYFFVYGTKFIFIFFALILTKKFILDKVALISSIFIHLAICIIISFSTTSILVPVEQYIYGPEHMEAVFNMKTILDRFVYRSDFNFFIYFSLVTFLYAFYYFRKQKEQELEHSMVKNQLLDAKIKSLQSQIQPHFLFNTLNGISSLTEIDVVKAQNAISDLSSLLRSTLSLNESKFHSLKDELDLLQKYINIEKIRFDEKLSIDVLVEDPSILDCSIPPLILQPIIENSIKHGFSYYHDSLKVVIKIKNESNNLIVEIENNGKKLANDHLNLGNGLKNIIERLTTIYEETFFFEIKNSFLKSGVIVTLKIPMSQEVV